jgi:hypothetical protein
MREWRKKSPHYAVHATAHDILNAAIKSGRIKRGPCEVCGKPKAHGHHDDYSKPLEVRWLCQKHHMQHHAAVAQSGTRTVSGSAG